MATFQQIMRAFFIGGGLAPIGALGPGLLPLAPLLMGRAGRKRQCDLRFPFNQAKRQACKAAVDAGAPSGGGGGLQTVAPGVAPEWQTKIAMARPGAKMKAGVDASMANMVVPLDEGAIAPGEGGTMTGGGAGSFLSSVPWWAWAGAAAVGGYLLLRRRS